MMQRREKCGKEVGRVVGEGENMRRVETRSVSGRSESSSGEVEEEVEGG